MFACTKFKAFPCPHLPDCPRGEICLFSHAPASESVSAAAPRCPVSAARKNVPNPNSKLKRPAPAAIPENHSQPAKKRIVEAPPPSKPSTTTRPQPARPQSTVNPNVITPRFPSPSTTAAPTKPSPLTREVESRPVIIVDESDDDAEPPSAHAAISEYRAPCPIVIPDDAPKAAPDDDVFDIQITKPAKTAPSALAAALAQRGYVQQAGSVLPKKIERPLASLNQQIRSTAIKPPLISKPPPALQAGASSSAPNTLFASRAAAYVSPSSITALSKTSRPISTKRPPASASAVIKTGQPPQLKPLLACKVPLTKRQKVVERFYDEFRRIYAALLAARPTAAHQHAVHQETQLLGRATAAGYSNVAIEILRRLKERPVAEDEKDVGIDGEWKPRPRVVIAEPPMDELEKLTTPIDQLRLMGYPFPPDETTAVTTPAAEQEDEMAEQHEKCDRCSKRFVPDWPLEEADMTVCRHHWGYARSLVSNGVKERQWSCCQQSLESQGCTEGPHVFKEEDTALLEKRIPFTVLPPSSPTSAKIVGIDCEMSYTTGGMDLTRLTIVPYIPNPPSGSNSANPTPLIDELVRTTYPVLDYNTRWSGISSLDSARYDIDGIKDLMATVVGRDTIIVGHGLENDLKAMRLYHTRIIDTAFLFPHPRGLPQRHSLRLLTQKVLGRFIQQGGSAGHDSAQDAVAALDLVRSRVMKGENARIH